MNIPDRIYAQYRNKTKTVDWINIATEMGGSLVDAAEAVRHSYAIDDVGGELLNVIGRIVVIDRNYFGVVQLNPGLFALLDGDEFGDEEAAFSELTTDIDSEMSDALYRLAIKSKIIKNNSDASIEAILEGMNFLLPNANILRVTDGEDMTFSIEFYGVITDLERWALLNANLVAKPQAVRFNGFLEGHDYVQFGDSHTQFGDTLAQFTGLIEV